MSGSNYNNFGNNHSSFPVPYHVAEKLIPGDRIKMSDGRILIATDEIGYNGLPVLQEEQKFEWPLTASKPFALQNMGSNAFPPSYSMMTGEVPYLKKELADRDAYLDRLEREAKERNREMRGLEDQIQNLNWKLKDTSIKDKDEVNDLKHQINGLKEKLKFSENNASKILEMEKRSKELRGLENAQQEKHAELIRELQKKEEELQNARNQLEGLRAKSEKEGRTSKKLEEEFAANGKRLAELTKELEKITINSKREAAELQEQHEQELANLKKRHMLDLEESKVPDIQQEAKEMTKLVTELQKRLKEHEKNNQEFEEELAEKDKEIADQKTEFEAEKARLHEELQTEKARLHLDFEKREKELREEFDNTNKEFQAKENNLHSDFEKRENGLQAEIKRLHSELENKDKGLEKREKELEAEKARLHEGLAEKARLHSEIETRNTEFEAKIARLYEELEKKDKGLEEREKELEAEIKRLHTELENKDKGLEEREKELEKREQTLRLEFDNANKGLQVRENDLHSDFNKRENELQAEIKKLRLALEGKDKEIKDIQDRNSEYMKHLQDVEEDRAEKIRALTHKLKDTENTNRNLAAEITELTHVSLTQKEKNTRLNIENAKLNKELQDNLEIYNREIEGKNQIIEEEKREKEKERRGKEEALNDLKIGDEKHQEEMNRLEKELNTFHGLIAQLQQKLAEKEEKIAEIEEQEDAERKNLSEVDSLNDDDRINELAERNRNLEEELEGVYSELAAYRQTLNAHQKQPLNNSNTENSETSENTEPQGKEALLKKIHLLEEKLKRLTHQIDPNDTEYISKLKQENDDLKKKIYFSGINQSHREPEDRGEAYKRGGLLPHYEDPFFKPNYIPQHNKGGNQFFGRPDQGGAQVPSHKQEGLGVGGHGGGYPVHNYYEGDYPERQGGGYHPYSNPNPYGMHYGQLPLNIINPQNIQPPQSKEEFDKLKKDLTEKEQEVAKLKEQLATTDATIKELKEKLATTDTTINELREKLDTGTDRENGLQTALSKVHAEHAVLEKQLDSATKEITALKGDIRDRESKIETAHEHIKEIEVKHGILMGDLDRAKEELKGKDEALKTTHAELKEKETTINDLKNNISGFHTKFTSLGEEIDRTKQALKDREAEKQTLEDKVKAQELQLQTKPDAIEYNLHKNKRERTFWSKHRWPIMVVESLALGGIFAAVVLTGGLGIVPLVAIGCSFVGFTGLSAIIGERYNDGVKSDIKKARTVDIMQNIKGHDGVTKTTSVTVLQQDLKSKGNNLEAAYQSAINAGAQPQKQNHLVNLNNAHQNQGSSLLNS